MSVGSHDAYVDVHAYSSTPGNAEQGQRVIGWAESNEPQPSGTPTELSSNSWPIDPRPPRGSGMTKDLQVLTHWPATMQPSGPDKFEIRHSRNRAWRVRGIVSYRKNISLH